MTPNTESREEKRKTILLILILIPIFVVPYIYTRIYPEKQLVSAVAMLGFAIMTMKLFRMEKPKEGA